MAAAKKSTTTAKKTPVKKVEAVKASAKKTKVEKPAKVIRKKAVEEARELRNELRTGTPVVTPLPKKAKKSGAAAFSAAVAGMQKKTEKTPAKGGEAPHVIVIARAGTGKTTTSVGSLNYLRKTPNVFTPSPQQQAIFDAIAQETPESVHMVAFNKSIAMELEKRLPLGVTASTMHSMGFSILRDDARYRRTKMNQYAVENILEKLSGIGYRDMYKQKFPVNEIKRLVELCKMNLIDPNDEDFNAQIDEVASHHEIEMSKPELIVDMVRRSLLKSMETYHEISFADMIWLPVVMKMRCKKYDLLIVDEAQDLNRCQQALAKMCSRRLVMVGDDRQAIYGFAGADCESIPRMIEELKETDRGVVVLPLTVTRRCGQAIVEEARKIVPEFEAHPSNGIGLVNTLPDAKFQETVKETDMVLCRVNAPLVSYCFRLLKEGRKARIQGRDIGQGLISLLKKMKANDLPELVEKLEAWYDAETEKLMRKKFTSEAQMIALDDKKDCLMCFCDACESVDEVIRKIESIFTDSGSGVLLSSVHRAKGLESDHVFILQPNLMPHPMAKNEWQIEQEHNLRYVAITRAIKELTYVVAGQ